MHSSFSSKLTYTKALYCFSSAWLFAQGAIATASGMNGAVADSPCIILYIIPPMASGMNGAARRQPLFEVSEVLVGT